MTPSRRGDGALVRGRVRQRPRAGDVWRLVIEDGRAAYVQFVCAMPVPHADIVRVLPGLYATPLGQDKLSELAAGPNQFMTEFPVQLISKMPGADYEGLFHRRVDLICPPPMLHGVGRGTDWHEWSVTEVDDGVSVPAPEYLARHPGADLDRLPRSGHIPFGGSLLAMIEAGWTPRMEAEHPEWFRELEVERRRRVGEPVPPPSPATAYLVGFGSKKAAYEAGAQLRAERLRELEAGMRTTWLGVEGGWTVSRPGRPAGGDESSVITLTKLGSVDPKVERRVAELAERLGGNYLGTEAREIPRWQMLEITESEKKTASAPSNPGPPATPSTSYFLMFPSRSGARQAVRHARRVLTPKGVTVESPRHLEVADKELWTLSVRVPGTPDPGDEEELSGIARQLGGWCDGNEVGPLN